MPTPKEEAAEQAEAVWARAVAVATQALPLRRAVLASALAASVSVAVSVAVWAAPFSGRVYSHHQA